MKGNTLNKYIPKYNLFLMDEWLIKKLKKNRKEIETLRTDKITKTECIRQKRGEIGRAY